MKALVKSLDWDDLRFFLAVAAAGSLSAASRELEVNTTTVLRRIAALETALDSRLFERLRSGYSLTAEGARLLKTLEPVDQGLSSLARDFKAQAEAFRGQVRLGTSEAVAAGLIAPAMAGFAETYPDIALDIVTDPSLTGPGTAPRVMNALRDVDIALRLARPTQGDMLVRKLGDIAYGLYAAPAYLEARAPKMDEDDLSGHQIIGFSADDKPLGPVWYLSRAVRDEAVVMRSSSAASRAAAAQSGLGLTALPCFMADKTDGLVRLAGPERVGALELWLLTRAYLTRLTHVRAVMDFLIAEIQRHGAVLAGQ